MTRCAARRKRQWALAVFHPWVTAMTDRPPAKAGIITKGEQTRMRLHRAAITVFARRGYFETKVSDIVQEAGVSQPTFYSYFDSKEVAYDQLVGEFRARLKAITGDNLIDPSTPAERFVERVALSFLRFLDFLAEDPDLTEIGFFQPPGCTVTKNMMVGWVTANIKQEQKDGLFRTNIDAIQIARGLVGIVDQMARIDAGAKQRTAIARDCADLFCGGAWVGPAKKRKR